MSLYRSSAERSANAPGLRVDPGIVERSTTTSGGGLRPSSSMRVEPGIIVMGMEVPQLQFESGVNLLAMAESVSKRLQKHPHTMIQYSQRELVDSMMTGRSIVCLDDRKKTMRAYGQLWRYPAGGEDVYEFGSWVSFKEGQGYGRQILRAAIELGYRIVPNGRLIAIIEHGNERAQKVILEEGGRPVGRKVSEQIINQQGKYAQMKVIELPRIEEAA